MGHLPDLISDLALILGAAAISTLIFKRLKQPLSKVFFREKL